MSFERIPRVWLCREWITGPARSGASAPFRRSVWPYPPGRRPAWRPRRHQKRPGSGRPERRHFWLRCGHSGHGDAAGHLHSGEQGVQSVHSAPLHGDADDRQGGVPGKGAGQMGRHTGGADQHAEAVLPGIPGELRGGGRGAVGAEDVGLIGDAELRQLGAGRLDNRPVAV